MKTGILLLALSAIGFAQTAQTKPTPKAPAAHGKVQRTKPEVQSVYSISWEVGEIKDCTTYSGHPNLLICDDAKAWPGSFIDLLGRNVGVGMSKDQAYERAFVEAVTGSKQFLVEFSDSYGRDPRPWPAPQTGRKMTSWYCSKEKVVSCRLGAREK